MVIENMRLKCEKTHPDLKWSTADAKHLDREFKRQSFDVVIDKSCLDAMLCDEGDCWTPSRACVERLEAALNSISNTIKMGGVFISIGFQQPFFRKQYFNQDACSFGWEQNITVKNIDRGLGYFYLLCKKDCVDHVVNLKRLQDPSQDVVRV